MQRLVHSYISINRYISNVLHYITSQKTVTVYSNCHHHRHEKLRYYILLTTEAA